MEKHIEKNLMRGTAIIVIVSLLAKVTSFIAEAILAAYLGTTYQSDAYYMVSSVQLVIYPMTSIGIWKVFLPLYKEKLTLGQMEEATSLTNKTVTFFTLVSLAVVALIMVFTATVVSVIAPGFEGQTRELCIRLVRVSAPMYVFIIDAAVFASVLQCHNKFLGSQIREVASHIPTILAAILLYRRFGITVMAAALIAGGAIRLLIELPFIDWGYRFKPDFSFRTDEFTTMLRRLPSALVSAGVAQLNALIDKAMASMLPEGSVSSLNYGHKLMNVFSGLLSTAVSTALYPQMIELITLKRFKELNRLLVKIIDIFSVLMIPVTLACVLFRTELVSAVFQRGNFNTSSTSQTASVFALYAIGILFVACSAVISNLFYGFGDTRTPMRIGIVHLAINVALNLAFIRPLGANGLALATSLSAILSLILRMIAAGKYLRVDHKSMLLTAGKVLFCSAVACGVPRVLFSLHPINRYLTIIFAAIIGVGIYLALLRLLHIQELWDVVAIAKGKIKK